VGVFTFARRQRAELPPPFSLSGWAGVVCLRMEVGTVMGKKPWLFTRRVRIWWVFVSAGTGMVTI
jgi:hypothetical protein